MSPADSGAVLSDPEMSGVVMLLLSVLQRAIRDYSQYRFDEDRQKYDCAVDAWDWFMSDDEDHFTSFCSVCRILNIDVSCMRSRIAGFIENRDGKDSSDGDFLESARAIIKEGSQREAQG